MSDVVSQSGCFEALTEEATLCQGPGVPILRVIGCLHSSDFVVSRPTVLKGFFVTLSNTLRIYSGPVNGGLPPFEGRNFLLCW